MFAEYILKNNFPEFDNLSYKALITKPFCIFTGSSGTGKTRLALNVCQRLTEASIAGDPFQKGATIQTDRRPYIVKDSDHLAVEFWNNSDETEATKITLPRKIIQEWVVCIKENNFDQTVSCREIRSIVSPSSKFSNQLHSFESPLKAAAFAIINNDSHTTITSSAIVSVGSDWTDNRHVLGFVNHLHKTDSDGTDKPIYQSTPVLDLLIEAHAHPDTPHFLVLDEMNLSHVERYFADFLSAMEQTDGKLNLHSEGARDDKSYTLPRYEGDTVGVPRSLYYPDNLFVIGTVNIDETTYMFSPKVLDRANVIEFKVEHDELAKFLDDPKALAETAKAEAGVAEAFLQLAQQVSQDALNTLPGETHKVIQDHLMDLFDIMQAGRFEFAYRTGKEVMRYMGVCRHLAGDTAAKQAWDVITGKDGWKSDLDDQILQKILPKLHGSIGRIGKLLAHLAYYCHDGKNRAQEKLSLKDVANIDPADAQFKKSFLKLQSMSQSLIDEQFVSFIQ